MNPAAPKSTSDTAVITATPAAVPSAKRTNVRVSRKGSARLRRIGKPDRRDQMRDGEQDGIGPDAAQTPDNRGCLKGQE